MFVFSPKQLYHACDTFNDGKLDKQGVNDNNQTSNLYIKYVILYIECFLATPRRHFDLIYI